MTETTAIDLAREHDANLIAAKLEVFDWLAEKKDKRIAKSPAGYLVDSIRKGYAEPKGFVSKAVREERAKKDAQARRKAEEERRRQAQEEAKAKAEEQAREARINAYWESLTPDQQAALMEAALDEDPKKREEIAYMKRQRLEHFAKSTEMGIRDDYIERLLAEKAPV